jgi:hypothetical protein
MAIDHFKPFVDGVDVGEPPTLAFGRKVVMTNSGSVTANRTGVWTDPDSSGGNPVASITVTGGGIGIIENITDLAQTSGTCDWDSDVAVTTGDHNTTITVTITDGDGNTDSDSFLLEVYTLGTTKITVDKPHFEFCVGDDQTMKGLWIDNNIDRIEIAVDGGTPFTVSHSGFQGGEWTWAPSPDLTAGEYSVEATIYDLDGTPNTDTVSFNVTICNELAAAPEIAFDLPTYDIDLRVSTSKVFTGTLTAPGASDSEPIALTMEAWDPVGMAWNTLAGTFSGYSPQSSVAQNWTWTSTVPLYAERQNLRVTLTQDQNAAQATAEINYTHDDPLQAIPAHPGFESDTLWTFYDGMSPSIPAWEQHAFVGNPPITGYGGGVLFGDDPISLKLTANSSLGTDQTYTPKFQIYAALIYNLRIETFINGVPQEVVDVLSGPLFNASDETNFELTPLSLFDGDDAEIRFSTPGATDPGDMSFWTFSSIESEPNGSGEPPDPGVYVDSAAAGGGDGSEALPFNNLADARDAVGNGETIYLKRGSVFTEQTLRLDKKIGVTVRDYGTGSKPVIDGNDIHPVSGGVPVSGRSLGLLEFDNCQSCTAINIRVINAAGAGLVGRDTTTLPGDIQGQDIHFIDCEVDSVSTWGIMLGGFRHSGDHGQLHGGSAVRCTVRNACKYTQGGAFGGGEGITITRAKDILIEDCEVWDHNKEGIVINNNSQNITVIRPYVHDRNASSSYGSDTGTGLYVDGSHHGVSGVFIDRAKVTGDSKGFTLASENGGDVDDVLVTNSLFYDNIGQGVGFPGDAGSAGPSGNMTNVRLYNCTIAQSNTAGHVIVIRETDPDKLAGLAIHGCIIARTVGGGIALIDDDASVPKGWEDWNILWNGGNPIGSAWNAGDNSTTDNPDFESIVSGDWPGNTDYYIAAASPAVDFLPTLSSPNDIAGTVRPKGASADAGCYERV